MKCEIITKHGGMPDRLFDKKQLEIGTRIEMEHTKRICLAKQIAKDHLVEKIDYYKKLKKYKL